MNESTSNVPANEKYTPFVGPWRVMKDRALEEKEAHERRGLENPCRQRTKKMWVSQEEMHRQKVPLYYR